MLFQIENNLFAIIETHSRFHAAHTDGLTLQHDQLAPKRMRKSLNSMKLTQTKCDHLYSLISLQLFTRNEAFFFFRCRLCSSYLCSLTWVSMSASINRAQSSCLRVGFVHVEPEASRSLFDHPPYVWSQRFSLRFFWLNQEPLNAAKSNFSKQEPACCRRTAAIQSMSNQIPSYLFSLAGCGC